jgi:hypothetical protein
MRKADEKARHREREGEKEIDPYFKPEPLSGGES